MRETVKMRTWQSSAGNHEIIVVVSGRAIVGFDDRDLRGIWQFFRRRENGKREGVMREGNTQSAHSVCRRRRPCRKLEHSLVEFSLERPRNDPNIPSFG